MLPADWVFQPPHDDVGIDGVVVICDDSPLNGFEFRVQIKSMERWAIRGDQVRVRGVKRSAIAYWLTGYTPTLLVLHEASSGRGTCAWANQLFFSQLRRLAGNTATVSFQVPYREIATPDTWQQIAGELAFLNHLVGEHVSVAARAAPILKCVHHLVSALVIFDFVANTKKADGIESEDDLQFLCDVEVDAHRQIVKGVVDLSLALAQVNQPIEGLVEFADDYASKCSEFVADFREIARGIDMAKDVTVDRRQMRDRRGGFARSALSLAQQLAELGARPRVKPARKHP